MKFPHSFTTVSILASLTLFSSCEKKEAESVSESSTESAVTIELLSHKNGKFTVAETVTVDSEQAGFAIGEKSFTIKSRWADVEVKRETLNNNPKEAHAVELKWAAQTKALNESEDRGTDPLKFSEDESSESAWIFPVGSEEGAPPLLAGTHVQARLLSPGTRLITESELKSSTSLAQGVQFHWKNKRYDLPEVGKVVFSGWTVVSVKEFQHALLNDDSTISESEDGQFVNRAVQVVIQAKDGSQERHVCFIDHPKLTEGIHPALLPVSRVSGALTSLSRLYVCETLKAPVEKSLLIFSPAVESEEESLSTWTWKKGESAPQFQKIETFPTTLSVGGQKIEITRHWPKARRQIKWQEKTGASEKDRHPALLIETGGHFHAKSFVLIKGKATPVKVMEDMLILRFR